MDMEKKKERMKEEAERICSLLSVSKKDYQEILYLCFSLIDKNLTQGRDYSKIIACFLYYISRKNNLSITMEDISKKLEINKNSLFRSWKEISKKMNLNKIKEYYDSILNELNNKLGLSEKELLEAKRIFLKIKSEKANNPKIIACVSLIIAGKRDIKEICKSSSSSISAVRKLLNWTKNNLEL